MAEQTIPLEDISRIDFLDISGDLHLTGWNREEIRLKYLGQEVQAKKNKTVLEISSPDDALVTIPHNLEVMIKSVTRDAKLKGLRGPLAIKSIAGDVIASDISSLTADSIAGDLIASRLQGNLQVKAVAGDSLIDNVQGQIKLEGVGGDIQIDTVSGGIDIKAGGDGSAEFYPVSWQAYQLTVGGDLILSMPDDTNVDLSIKSGEKNISIFPGKLDLKYEQKEVEHTLGEGGPTIMISAGGKVLIVDDDFTALKGIKMNLEDAGSIAADFATNTSEYIRGSLEHLEEDLAESLSGLAESLKDIGLSEEKIKELGTKIEETSRKTAEKAEIAAIKAQAKVEKKVAKARQKALRAQEKIKRFDLDQFLESQSSKSSVSESERLAILEMLQEKKISPEEAEELLQALEGKSK